jgi:hypothetical protein
MSTTYFDKLSDAILNDPCVSYWLKDAIRSATDRDCVDALHDAQTLVNVLEARVRASFGQV